MAQYKSQHYVPRCYLKSWETKSSIYSLPLGPGIVRKQETKKMCKKDHLYTLKDNSLDATKTFVESIGNPLFTELLTMSGIESNWSTVIHALENNFPIIPDLLSKLNSFVVLQSMRTPRFMREAKAMSAHINDPLFKANVSDAERFLIQHFQFWPESIKNCVTEIVECSVVSNFITSDNPATHWLKDGEVYHLLKGLDYSGSLFGNPAYRILCPIHPKFFVMLSPNLGIDTPDSIKKIPFRRNIFPDNVKQINDMIRAGADKMVFAKSTRDFI